MYISIYLSIYLSIHIYLDTPPPELALPQGFGPPRIAQRAAAHPQPPDDALREIKETTGLGLTLYLSI